MFDRAAFRFSDVKESSDKSVMDAVGWGTCGSDSSHAGSIEHIEWYDRMR